MTSTERERGSVIDGDELTRGCGWCGGGVQNKLGSAPCPLHLPLLRELWLSGNRITSLAPWREQQQQASSTPTPPKEAAGGAALRHMWLPSLRVLFLQDNRLDSHGFPPGSDTTYQLPTTYQPRPIQEPTDAPRRLMCSSLPPPGACWAAPCWSSWTCRSTAWPTCPPPPWAWAWPAPPSPPCRYSRPHTQLHHLPASHIMTHTGLPVCGCVSCTTTSCASDPSTRPCSSSACLDSTTTTARSVAHLGREKVEDIFGRAKLPRLAWPAPMAPHD